MFVGDGRQKSTGGKVQICRQYSSGGNLAKKLEQCFKTKRKPGRRSWVQPAGFGKKVPLANRKQLTEYNCRLYRFEKKQKYRVHKSSSLGIIVKKAADLQLDLTQKNNYWVNLDKSWREKLFFT